MQCRLNEEECQRTERALHERDEYFRLLIEDASDIVTLLGADGTILYQSRSLTRVLGYDPSERIGENIFATPLAHPEDLDAKRDFLARALATPGGTVSATFRLRHTDGTWRHIEAAGRNLVDDPRISGVVASYRDVTERKRAEVDLALYRLMVESAQDYGIFRLDPDGRVASWNVGAERIKGYAAEEILGRHFSLFYPTEDLEHDKPGQELVAAASMGRFEDEGWRLRKDGSRFWANVVITALRDDHDRLLGFSKITRDLTERKRAEDEVRQLNETLEERVRERTRQLEEVNASLEAFASSASHDLRAPLRGIQGLARVLLEDHAGQLDAAARDYVARIDRAGAGMDRLVQDLLAYGRLGRVEFRPRPVDLGSAVGEALGEVAEALRVARARVDVAPGLPPVLAHPTVLVQVLANLLSNAAKFGKPGGQPRIEVQAERRESRVRLWVIDDGIGIAPEDRERIFEPFERLHGIEAYPGTGVGLAIVRRGVERMGGRSGVEARTGGGSRFWVELPRAG